MERSSPNTACELNLQGQGSVFVQVFIIPSSVSDHVAFRQFFAGAEMSGDVSDVDERTGDVHVHE